MHLVGLLSSYFAHDARSQELKACNLCLSPIILRKKSKTTEVAGIVCVKFSTASNERFKLCQHNRYLICCIDCSFLWGGGKLKRVLTACARSFPATANIPLKVKYIHCSNKSINVHVLCAHTRISHRSALSSSSLFTGKM